MYVRFSVIDKDERSGIGMGLFGPLWKLQNKDALLEHEIEVYESTMKCFARNLIVPKVLAGGNHHSALSGHSIGSRLRWTDQPVFTVPPQELPKTRAVLTLVGGKIVLDTRADRVLQ